MQMIKDVKNVIVCNHEPFNIKLLTNDERKNITKHTFDIIIIPTKGNYDSYDNVIEFTKNIYKNRKERRK